MTAAQADGCARLPPERPRRPHGSGSIELLSHPCESGADKHNEG